MQRGTTKNVYLNRWKFVKITGIITTKYTVGSLLGAIRKRHFWHLSNLQCACCINVVDGKIQKLCHVVRAIIYWTCGPFLTKENSNKMKPVIVNAHRDRQKLGSESIVDPQCIIDLIRHPLEDDDITVVFFPGVQLATGKKGRFLYVFDRDSGNRSSNIDIVYLLALVV